MESKYLVIILLIGILILFQINNQSCIKNENFTNKYVANDHIYLGRRRDPWDLLDDSLFTNVIRFTNDDDPYSCNGRIGLEKCLESCPKGGRCVEFGVTGEAFCYPPDNEEALGKDRWETVNSRTKL